MQWPDFETTRDTPQGWTALPQTAWGVMFAWVAGPGEVLIQPSGEPVFGVPDEWALANNLEMLVEADVPAPIWPWWIMYYQGNFEVSSYLAHEALPSDVPVTPAMMIGAMRSTRNRWS